MINTSIAYRRAIEKNREFRVLDRVTFKDGSYIDLQLSDLMSYKINEATSSSGRFDIGAAVIKEYTITLNNMDGRFDLYDFEGADIRARIGLKLENGSWEDLNKGTYRVVDAVFTDVTLQLTAYDAMLFFDRPYSKCTLSYPATVLDIVRSACRDCQVTFDASTVEMGSYRVEKRPADGSITYRDVIGYCAQIMGSFARIDHLGQLSFGWYNFDSIPSGGLNGGVYDDGSPYVSGDRVDGGTFDNYGAGASYDAGSFSDLDYAHNFYNMRSQSINTADITVTGIQIEVKGDDSKKETYLYGTDTYALEIKDNPLIQAATVQAVAKHVGDKVINRPFRPLSITIQSDPSIEAGDMALVTDRKQNSYVTCVTETTFALGSAQQVSCSAETPSEKTYTRYGAGIKLLDKAKDEAETLLSDYDIAVQNMNELAANTMGFYFSAVMQPDGSLVSYRHDKPKLSDSKIVYKKGIDGFFVTQNYTGDDATTQWTSGFDSSGNAVLNILSAIGINFDWAHGGTLTLGGKSNGNGKLEVYDENDNLIGKWSKDSLMTKAKLMSITEDGAIFSNDPCAIGSLRMCGTIGSFVDVERAQKTMAEVLSLAFHNSSSNSNTGLYSLYVGSNYQELGWKIDDVKIFQDTEISKNLLVRGTKNRVVNTKSYGDRLLYCHEIPTPMFSDLGCAKTNDIGIAIIDIDPVFYETVNTSIEYQVFLQKEGQGDLWVDEKTQDYFIVKGTPNLNFSWEIKCIQKDFEARRLENNDFLESVRSDLNRCESEISEEIEMIINEYDKEMEELINEGSQDY